MRYISLLAERCMTARSSSQSRRASAFSSHRALYNRRLQLCYSSQFFACYIFLVLSSSPSNIVLKRMNLGVTSRYSPSPRHSVINNAAILSRRYLCVNFLVRRRCVLLFCSYLVRDTSARRDPLRASPKDYSTSTEMLRGLDSAALGSVSVSTPFSTRALA